MTTTWEDIPINVKLKLSALWIVLMCLYIYADVLSLYQPDVMAEVMTGTIDGIEFTQTVLFGAAILVTLPSLMIFLSLTLNPRLNRGVNILLGLVYTGVNLANLLSFEDPWTFIIFYNLTESVVTLFIVWTAWKWSRVK